MVGSLNRDNPDYSLSVDAIDFGEELLAAMEVVERATAATEADQGFFTRFGLRDTDLDAELADVRVAVQEGRFDDAETEAAEIDRLIAEAPGDAKAWFLRLALVSTGCVLIVGSTLTWWLVRRRRGRRTESGRTPGAPGTPGTPGVPGPAQPVAG